MLSPQYLQLMFPGLDHLKHDPLFGEYLTQVFRQSLRDNGFALLPASNASFVDGLSSGAAASDSATPRVETSGPSVTPLDYELISHSPNSPEAVGMLQMQGGLHQDTVANDHVDLRAPEHALQATPDALFNMTLEAKADLKRALNAAHKARLTPYQKAAINLDDVLVPAVEADVATLVYSSNVVQFEGPDGTRQTRTIPHSSIRWYSIPVGKEFSGVVQGSQAATLVTSGCPGASSLKHLTREAAEFSWLKAFHQGSCKRVVGTTVEELRARHHVYP